MFPLGPTPFENAAGDVTVDGTPIVLVRDEQGNTDYQVNDPERFADKISTGDLGYGDFNPYENAFAKSRFDGSYGLRRFTDGGTEQEMATAGHTYEPSNIDGRFGPATLGPQLLFDTPITVAGANPRFVWLGDWTPGSGAVTGPHFVGVFDDNSLNGKIKYRNADGTWTDTGLSLSFPGAQVQAVIPAGGSLIIGYGNLHPAQFIKSLDASGGVANVTNTALAALFIFAGTTDRAAVYVVGGTASTMVTNIISAPLTAPQPATSFATDANAISCGAPTDPILNLAPGGGIAVVFVLKTSELGEIAEVQTAGLSTTAAIYRTLVPFDVSSSDSSLFTWWMGRPGDQQRGPTVLAFPRSDSLWTYAPSSQESGQANNIAPWAKRGFRPQHIIGIPLAAAGTARFLYYLTQGTGVNGAYILCQDGQTGETTALVDAAALGFNFLPPFAITSLFGNPRLFFGIQGLAAPTASVIASVVLSAQDTSPLDDPNCTFAARGTLDEPAVAHGFPDEDKVEFTVRMVHDGVIAGAQDISVYASFDGGPYQYVGNAATGTSSEAKLATAVVCKRIAPRFVLSSTNPHLTPSLLAYSVRASINPLLYREWTFTGEPAMHQTPNGAPDLQNVYDIVQNFWGHRQSGIPFSFTDAWGDFYTARLLRFHEAHTKQEQHMPPTVRLTFDLLEVAPNPQGMVWDSTTAVWDSTLAVWGA